MTINIHDALRMQDDLQAQAYGKPLSALQGDELKEAMRTHVLALLDEVHEVLHEVPWKPWKKQGEPHWGNFQAEMVDALHFYMNLMLIAGITWDDLLRGYEEKHRINIERQDAGY